MMNIFRSEERGGMNIGWLNTSYSFSFANWHNPARMGFGKVRVFNDDLIYPDGKFEMHPHSNMEIVTIVLSGAVTHEDSMGNKSKIKEGMIQVMSAGSGVVHSEANEEDKELHLYQIWIEPDKLNIKPAYGEKEIGWNKNNGLTELVSGKGSGDVMSINQDVSIYSLSLEQGLSEKYHVNKGRGLFLFLSTGELNINGEKIQEGDSVEILGEEIVEIEALTSLTAVLIDTVL